MDPLTWIGAISGVLQITQVISQTASGLSKLKGKFSNADLTIQSLIREMTTIKSAVIYLEDWTRYNACDTTESEEYTGGLNVALEGCRAVMEVLSEEVASLTQNSAGQDTAIGFRARVRVVWNEDTMRGHQDRLRAQVAALQLLLQACQCRSLSEQVELLRKAENLQIIQKVADDTATLRGSSYAGSHAPRSNGSVYQPSVSHTAINIDRSLTSSPSSHQTPPHSRSRPDSRTSTSYNGDIGRDTDEGYASGATGSPILSQSNSFSLSLRPYDSIVLGNGHSKSVTYRRTPRQISQSHVRRTQSTANPPLSLHSPPGSKRERFRSVFRRFSLSNLTSTGPGSPAVSPTTSATTRGTGEKDLKMSIDLTSPEGATAPSIVKLAQAGSRPDVEILIESGHGIETPHINTRRTALLVAAHCGHDAVVDLLIQKKARLEAVDAWGSTALHLAASRGHCNVLELLLLASAKTEACDGHGRTALWVAAHRGQLEATRMLIAHHAKVNVRAQNHMTALHAAAKRGDEAIVELLVSCGADLEARDGTMMTALHYACEEGHQNVIRLLLDRKANINAPGGDRKSPLICAAAMGRALATQELLKWKASIRCVDDHSMTALHWAAFNGHTEIVELLSQKKGGLAVTNKLGRTALHLAAMNSHFAVVELLLRKSVSVEARCLDGLTPLHYACLADNLEIARLMLISDADIEAQTHTDQRRPIHIAAANGSMGLLNFLVDKGASLEARDAMGDRALGVACRHGHAAAVQNLLGRGCPLYLNFEDNPQEDSPLCLAAMEGHLPVVSLLLEHGASVVKKDKLGWQPHHYAAYNGHPQVLSLLLCHKPVSTSDGTSFGLDALRIGFAPNAGISEKRKEQIHKLLRGDSEQLEARIQSLAFRRPLQGVETPGSVSTISQMPMDTLITEPTAAASAVAPQELPVTLEQGLPPSRSITPEHMRRGRHTDGEDSSHPRSSGPVVYPETGLYNRIEPDVSHTGDNSQPAFDYPVTYSRGSPVPVQEGAQVETPASEPTEGTT